MLPFIQIKQKGQVTHTYTLNEAKVFMEATKGNKEKIDIINSCFSSGKSLYNVCFWLIRKLTIRRTVLR